MIKRTVKFVVAAMLFAVITLLATSFPKIVVEVFKYMSIDVGYKWVLNMVVAFIVAAVVYHLLKGKESAASTKVRVIVAIIIFLLLVVICECVIWHPSEALNILKERVNPDKVKYVALGMLFGIEAFVFLEIFGKNTQSKHTEPKKKSSHFRRRENDSSTEE